MARAAPKPTSVDEFLAWERTQAERYEFIDGAVRLMVGGTVRHNLIVGNIYAALRAGLRGGPCTAVMEAVKVATAAAATYPDVAVTCAEFNLEGDLVPEPVVVIEVLSPSTEDTDRGRKRTAYQAIPSLRHYVLVAQDRRRVELFTRAENGDWAEEVLADPQATLRLPALGIEIPVAEIYERALPQVAERP